MTDTIRRVQCADLISRERIPPIELFNMSITSNICVCVRACVCTRAGRQGKSLSLPVPASSVPLEGPWDWMLPKLPLPVLWKGENLISLLPA